MVQEVHGTEELLEIIHQIRSPILICSDPDSSIERRLLLQFLLNLGSSVDIPVLWLGEVTSDYEIALSGCFSNFSKLKNVESNHNISAAVVALVQSLGPRARDYILPEEEAQLPHTPEPEKVSLRKSIIGERDETATSKRFQTEHVRSALKLEVLQYAKLLPQNPVTQNVVRRVVDSFRRLDQLQILRTTYMGSQLVSSMPLDEEWQEAAKAATALYANGFPRTSSNVLLNGKFSLDQGELSRDIGIRYEESAKLLNKELSTAPIGEILRGVADILRYAETPHDEAAYMASSSLLAADITMRHAFQRGLFHGFGAKDFLNKMRSGKFDRLHPQAREMAAQFLVETLAEGASSPKSRRDEAGNTFVQVGLADLKPGMTLVKPLRTRGGEVILHQDTFLDSDLIFRIWQMAAICRLDLPCCVETAKLR
jgi:hypothetical protein